MYIYLLKLYGYEEDSTTLYFDIKKLKENASTIHYLFGQLEDVHKRTFRVSPQSASIRYDGTVWTKDNGLLMEFLYLGRASDVNTPFFKKAQLASISSTLVPTLSPKDPNFDTWYKDYQAKMNRTQRAPGGFEPGE